MNTPLDNLKIQLLPYISIMHNAPNVLSIYFDLVHTGWQQWFLLSSDRHHDAIECDREFEKKHLDMAVERNAYILDFGDPFDAMQGRYDPRRSMDNVRPEYKSAKYLTLIEKDAAEHYAPYAKNFLLIGRGNHDQMIIKNNGVDIVSNLVNDLNAAGGTIQAGGYGGWVRFMFAVGGTSGSSKKLKYYHGSGGGGQVTRGVIQSNRQAVFLPDADIVVNGHTHDSWIVPIARERLSDRGIIKKDIQTHVRTSTYKDDYKDGSDGWWVESGKSPRPVGAVWMRMYYEDSEIKTDFIQDVK